MTTFALALDLGGTKLDAALVDPSGTVLAGSRARRATGRDITPAALDEALAAVVAEALTALPADAQVVGAGIGSAGPVDRPSGGILPVNMPALVGFDLAAAVARAVRAAGLDVPVVLGHDGGALALAESWIGAAADAVASLSIVVSTGIGGGFVLGGALMTGASGNAGHLGQTLVGDTTLEEIASGPASIAWARAQGWSGTTGMELGAAAAAGDATARAAVERSARAVGIGLANASTLVDLDVISIGGGFSHVSDDYIELVGTALREAAVLEFARRVRVVRSALGDEGPLIGAAALILRRG
ncbi:ROK family protein [Microbacterium sp. PA5]|uniref:ROK family protein n=1 Tax=Microbacterium sp. PA5 TaxID=3416654 RepID=UPI003CE7AC12